MNITLLADAFYDYSKHIKGYTPATIRRYRYVLTLFSRLCAIHTTTDITPTALRRLFFHGRAERHWSVNTYLVFHKSLSAFCSWCVREGYMQENPLCQIEKPKLEHRLPNRLSTQDAARLLEIVYNYPYKDAFLRARNHALFATFLYAGLRLHEALSLMYTDVDVPNGVLYIRCGKGKKDRVLPMAHNLKASLDRYCVERARTGKTAPEFFCSRQGAKGFTSHGLKHLMRHLTQTLGIPFSIHALRHTFAVLMLEGGCDLYSLSKMMGHSDIKTTSLYLAASPQHLQSQIGKHMLQQHGRLPEQA